MLSRSFFYPEWRHLFAILLHFSFSFSVSLQWVAQTARQHCRAALIHSYTPTINREQVWKLRPEHPLWKGCAASCSGNVWDHRSPSPLISSYAESRWSDASPFSAFSSSCTSKVQQLLSLFLFCACLNWSRTRRGSAPCPKQTQSTFNHGIYQKLLKKNNLNFVLPADATPCRPDLWSGRETET